MEFGARSVVFKEIQKVDFLFLNFQTRVRVEFHRCLVDRLLSWNNEKGDVLSFPLDEFNGS